MEAETQNIAAVEEEEKAIIDYKNIDGGLEILVDLAEKGEIDPWDVDIVEVTDKFLAALNSSPRENLLNAGRAIFYACVLLRLKSDLLLNLSSETLSSAQETDDFFPEDEMLDDESVHIDLTKLESFVQRSSQGRQQRKRKIILTDLILALQQAEEEEEKRALRAKIRAERKANTIVSIDIPDDVLEMAHEDIDQVIESIESIVEEHLTDDEPLTLSFLTKLLNNQAKPFLAIIFMAHAGKVVLEQKEVYGEVYIHKPGKVLDDVVEQQKANEEAEKINKENAKKYKERKKKRKLKDKIKDAAKKIKDKLTGKKDSKDEEKAETPEADESIKQEDKSSENKEVEPIKQESASSEVKEPEIIEPIKQEDTSEENEESKQTLNMDSATIQTPSLSETLEENKESEESKAKKPYFLAESTQEEEINEGDKG